MQCTISENCTATVQFSVHRGTPVLPNPGYFLNFLFRTLLSNEVIIDRADALERVYIHPTSASTALVTWCEQNEGICVAKTSSPTSTPTAEPTNDPTFEPTFEPTSEMRALDTNKFKLAITLAETKLQVSINS